MAGDYKAGPDFNRAAECWASVQYALDAGEHADEEEKGFRRFCGFVAEEYGVPESEVLRAAKRAGMDAYLEGC